MIMTAARTDSAPAGAKRYLEVFREMRENLADNLITMNPKKPGSQKEEWELADNILLRVLAVLAQSYLYYPNWQYNPVDGYGTKPTGRISN